MWIECDNKRTLPARIHSRMGSRAWLQIDLAVRLNYPILAFQIAQECIALLQNFKEALQGMLNEACHDYFSATPENRPPGMVFYLIATVNNTANCKVYIEQLQERIRNDLLPEFVPSCEKLLEETVSEFLQLAELPVDMLVTIVFGDLKPVFEKLFSKEWFGSTAIMQTVVATLEDYFRDFSGQMNPVFLRKLSEDILQRAVVLFLRPLFARKSLAGELPAFRRRFEEDLKALVSFFGLLILKEVCSKHLAVLYDVFEVLRDDPETIASTFFKLRKNHPDFTLDMMEQLLNLRGDMGKEVGKTMQSLKGMMAQSGGGKGAAIEGMEGVFSRVRAKDSS
jgi:hypothetical protein